MYGAPATSAGTPAAYAHKSPGQGHCTATPGWPGGRDGRKSIKSKIIDTTATDSAIVGNMPHLFRTASPARNASNERAGTPRRIPRPGLYSTLRPSFAPRTCGRGTAQTPLSPRTSRGRPRSGLCCPSHRCRRGGARPGRGVLRGRDRQPAVSSWCPQFLLGDVGQRPGVWAIPAGLVCYVLARKVREVGSFGLVLDVAAIVLDRGHLRPYFGLGRLPDVVPLQARVLAIEVLTRAHNLCAELLTHKILRRELSAADDLLAQRSGDQVPQLAAVGDADSAGPGVLLE